MAVVAAAHPYTASNGTENIGLREFCLLDIIPRSLGVLVKGNTLCSFTEKGSRVPITSSKYRWNSLPEQNGCHFSIRESGNIDVGISNIEIAEFLLTQEVFHPEQK